jgi:Asp-tRNA(Asn)/Glu-tRNA(Gln) amidotransferase A subunit family amidase
VSEALALAATHLRSAGAPSTGVVGRVRIAGTDPVYEAAIDRALAVAELEIVDLTLAGWDDATVAARTVLFAEGWETNAALYREAASRLSPDVAERLAEGATLTSGAMRVANAVRESWRREVRSLLGVRVEAIALPAMLAVPARLGEHSTASNPAALAPSLLPGPALSLPVPCGRPIPAALQLLGAENADIALLSLAARIESAAAAQGA